MICPECQHPMVEQSFDGQQGKSLSIDLCQNCGGLWFDTKESLRLSPKGTLMIFRAVYGARRSRLPHENGLRTCPRCDEKLVLTRDQAHGHFFQYGRCERKHGHFITFFQFLREKGLVRALEPRELDELRKHVDTVLCSDCGAALQLADRSTCQRCHAPLCILDPQCVQATVKEVQHAAGSRRDVAPHVAAQLMMNKLNMRRFRTSVSSAAAASASGVLHSASPSDSSSGWSGNLVEVGVDILVDVLGEVLGSVLSDWF